MRKKIVIAGGAGYIGSKLIHQIIDKYNIVVIDNFTIDTAYKRKQIKALRGVELIEAGISEVEKYKGSLADTNIIVYMSSLNSHTESALKPIHYLEENSKALQLFIDNAKKICTNLEKIILTSSRAVYGEGRYQCDSCQQESYFATEEDHCDCGDRFKAKANLEKDLTMPRSIYGMTKRFQEEQLMLYALERNLAIDIFRIYNVFGFDQEKFYNHIGILPMLYKQIQDRKEVTLFGKGEIYRDFIDVEDVVKVLIQSIDRSATFKREIYNLGTGESYSLLDICQIFKQNLKQDFKINLNDKLSDIRYSQANTEKLKNNFSTGFKSIGSFIKEYYL